MEQHEIMTVDEVAAFVRVSERTVYEWAQKGELPAGKLGSTWRFRRSDVQEWVDKRLGGTVRQAPQDAPKNSLDFLLKPENVVILDPGNKKEALDRLIDTLSRNPEILNPQDLRNGIYHREELMSTGIGQGLGIPHVRLDTVKNIVLAVGLSVEPIADYLTLDNGPVHLLFMIAAGKNQHAEHIKLLSSISSRFKEEKVRNKVLGAQTPEEAYNLIKTG